MDSHRMTRRQFVRLSLLGAAGAAAAACGATPTLTPVPPTATKPPAATAVPPTATKPAATPTPAGPKMGGTLNYAESGDFNSFNPWNFSAVNNSMYNQVFSRLTYVDSTGVVHKELAETAELAKDGLSFRVKIKEGVKWHDGKEHVAEDWVKSYAWTQNADLQKASASVRKLQALVAPLKEVKAVDKYTVDFLFKAPLPYFYDILDYWYLIRIDDPADPEFMKAQPIGTGPFKQTERVAAQYVRYVKNADYHIKGQPRVDQIMFKRLEKAETLLPNLDSGAVDGYFVGSLGDVAQLKAKNYNLIIDESAGSIFNIIVNVNKPPLDKKEVRQALSYSLNRVDIAKSACFGVSSPICTPFYTKASLGYREDLVMAHPFNLDKAKSMLEAAGVKNLELTINPTPAWPQMKLFCLIWQQDLAKIGVKLIVNEVENARFYEIGQDPEGKLKGMDLHPWLNGRTTRDPAVFLGTQHNYRGGATNVTNKWKNDELEKLIADAAVEVDTAKRKAAYQRCNEIIVTECSHIQVATNPRVWTFTNKVKEVHIDQNGDVMFDTTWLDK